MRSDHGAEWMTIADRFAQHDDVRHNIVTFKTPEVFADAAIARLHFIRNANATGLAHRCIHLGEIAGRKNNLSRDARKRLGNESRHGDTPAPQTADDLKDMIRIFFRGEWIVASI